MSGTAGPGMGWLRDNDGIRLGGQRNRVARIVDDNIYAGILQRVASAYLRNRFVSRDDHGFKLDDIDIANVWCDAFQRNAAAVAND